MRHFTIQQEDPQARETRNLTVSRETKFRVWSLSCFDYDRPWISLFTTINATLLQNIHIIKNKKTFP